MSVAESQVSIFDGLVDGDLNELRGQRTALSEDHRALMAEYARMSAMDPDLRVDHQREFDSFRQDWFRKVMKFVNLVRASYAAGRMSDTHFTSSVEYVDEVLRPRWAQTRFFGKTFPHVDIPSHDDIVAPPRQSRREATSQRLLEYHRSLQPTSAQGGIPLLLAESCG